MSWFASAVPAGENVHPPTSQLRSKDAPLFGPLTPEDTMWTCSSAIVTETQIWYLTLPGNKLAMVQIIHSGVGLWQVQIQFTFGLYEMQGDKAVRNWKSVSVTNFKTPHPPSAKGVTYDKRSAKSDQFSITVDPAKSDTYVIEGQYDGDVAISLEFKQLPGAPGWKLGEGVQGGMTYFGSKKAANGANGASANEPDKLAGGDGYAIHRIWPRCSAKGIIRQGGAIIDVPESTRGIFIHAIQGMRPNLLASRWNFADFQSSAEDGVSLVMMEFTTTSAYGTKKVNIGSVVVDDKLVAVTYSSDGACEHQSTRIDKETGYKIPGRLVYKWSGPAIGATAGSVPVTAELSLDVSEEPAKADAYGFSSRNMVAKVSVLAEIPYLVRKVISMAGTSPFIYQWLKEGEAKVSLPALEGKEARQLTVKGTLYNEATFISEP